MNLFHTFAAHCTYETNALYPRSQILVTPRSTNAGDNIEISAIVVYF
jgi:hypothetical protein